jgi:hypothetical protein
MIVYTCSTGNCRATFVAEYGYNRVITRLEDLEKNTVCQRCGSELEKQGVRIYPITVTLRVLRGRDEHRRQLREAGLRRIDQYQAEQERDTDRRVQETLAAMNGHRSTAKAVDSKREKRERDREQRQRMKGPSGGGGNSRKKMAKK